METMTLVLLDEEIIAIDVEAWVTLQMIAAALRREKEREGKTKGMTGRLGERGGKGWDDGKGLVGKGTEKWKGDGVWTLHPEQHP